MCHRSINYVAEMMETKFGVPWIKINFIGANGHGQVACGKSPNTFGRAGIDRQGGSEVIAEEMPEVEAARKAEYRPRTEGKRAMLFVGGSRAHHYQELFGRTGHEVPVRRLRVRTPGRLRRPHGCCPDIKVDADSRNIEELEH